MTEGVEADRVSYGGEATVEGYLARPSGDGSYPGVILIQEASGIDRNIMDTTERLAAESFVVLAPDLYHGKTATSWDEARELLQQIDQDRALDELAQSIDYLQGRDDVQPKQVGVVGFCMGGRFTWWTAMREGDELAAIAPFYAGRFQPTPEELSRVTAPALIFWGTEDASTPEEDRSHIVETLQQQGKTFEVREYRAGHAFMNPFSRTYSEEAAKQAWPELVAWFKRYLR